MEEVPLDHRNQWPGRERVVDVDVVIKQTTTFTHQFIPAGLYYYYCYEYGD